MLRKEAVDPVTGSGILPHLGQFSSLDSLEMGGMGYAMVHEAVDLNTLHSVLETWTSSTQDRRLSVSIWTKPEERTRDNMLEFMRKVGDILAGQLDEVNMHPAATLVSEANKAT